MASINRYHFDIQIDNHNVNDNIISIIISITINTTNINDTESDSAV